MKAVVYDAPGKLRDQGHPDTGSALIQKAGGQGLFVRGDVREESEIEALVAKTLEHFGRLDFAFNNAGVGGEVRATMTATADIYNRIMDINVRGIFFSMKHQIPAIFNRAAVRSSITLRCLRCDEVRTHQSTVPVNRPSSD